MQRRVEPAARPGGADTAKMRVLIVEDERKTRESLMAELTSAGYAPIAATRGFEAIKLADQFRPELIILDGLVPEMHGFEIARFIRRLDVEYKPRIVLMTAIYKHLRYQNEAQLKYGIDEYVMKPLLPQDVKRLTRDLEAAS